MVNAKSAKQQRVSRISKPSPARKKSLSLNETLGHLVEHHRTKLNLSLDDLSQLTEVSVRDLSRLENGECTLALEKLFRISNYLNIPPSALLSAIHGDD